MREGLKNKRILVVGDTIIDRDVFLVAIGLSLESPTIKANFLNDRAMLGGAANVAKFLGMFGCQCTFATSLSDDKLLKSLNQDYEVDVIPICNKPNNVKTRYWITKGDNTYKYLQVNQCDTEEHNETLKVADEYDVILVSDYRCGIVNPKIISGVLSLSGKKMICSQMSDRKSNMKQFSGFDVAIMNEAEYSCCDMSFPTMVVTLGSRGSKTLHYGKEIMHHDAFPTIAHNTIGAGDAFCAAYAATENETIANKFASYYLSLQDRNIDSLRRFWFHES